MKRNTYKRPALGHALALRHLTSQQRLRVLRRLYEHASARIGEGLDEIYEDICAWHAPSECFTDIVRSRNRNFEETIEQWFLALFPMEATRDAEVYGAYFMSLMRSRVWYLRPPRHNPYTDLVSYLKFSDLLEFVADAESVVCVERSHMRDVREMFDAHAALQKQFREIRLGQTQNNK